MPRKRAAPEKVREVVIEAPVRSNAITILLTVSVIFLVLSAAYNYLTPMKTPAILQHRDGGSANPDEGAHALYVSTLASGHLPVFNISSPDYEAHQPPLYYLIAAAFYKASGDFHTVRWAATLLGLLLIWIVFFTVRECLPDMENVALAASIIVSLLPMNIALSSSVSNDTAANLVFVLYLLVMGRYFRNPSGRLRYATAIAVIIAAGIYTKSSTLILLPLTLLAMIYVVWTRMEKRSAAGMFCAISLAGGSILGIPWLLRNQALYGDPFAQHVIFHDLASRNVTPTALIAALGPNWYLERFFGWTFASYWGVFDSMNLFLPQQIYIVLAIAATVTIVAGVMTLTKRRSSRANAATLIMFAALIALTLIAYVQYNQHFFQVQGRYLYPALVPLTAFSAAGLISLVPKPLRRWTLVVLAGVLIVLNLYCLSIISGRFTA